VGLHPGLAQRTRELLQHDAMEVHTPPARNAIEAQAALKAPILLLGLSAGGVEGALALLARLREGNRLPFTILLGQVKDKAQQPQPSLAGVATWVPLPLPAPRPPPASRRSLEWTQAPDLQWTSHRVASVPPSMALKCSEKWRGRAV